MISERSVPTITNSLGQTLYTDDRDHVYVQMAGKYLRNAQLSGMDLQGIDFRDCNLSEANFEGANLSGCKFDDADLSKANLRNAILDKASLRKTNLEGSTLEDASMQGADLEEANLQNSWAPKVDLSSSNLIRANLSRANLAHAKVQDSHLSWTRIGGANLTGVDFTGNRLLDVNHVGVFETELWSSTKNSIEWPPKDFHTDTLDPVFDNTTKWPRGMRFPKRRLQYKIVAEQGLLFFGVLSLALLFSALLGFGAARSFLRYGNSMGMGGLLATSVFVIAISIIAEVIRIVVTNRLVDIEPDLYYSASMHECERQNNEVRYVVIPRLERTTSYLDFLRSLLKSQ